MKKSHLALCGGILATMIAAGGMAMAHGKDEKPKFMNKVVEEGVITQEQADKIKEYHKQDMEEKRAEMKAKMQEMMEQHVKDAVEDGTITQEEADQIKVWHDARPEALEKLGPPMKGMKGNMGKGAKGMFHSGM